MLLPSFITNVMVMMGAASATENLKKKKNMILSWKMKNNSKPLQEVEYYDLYPMEEATLKKGNHLDLLEEATLKDGNYPFQHAVGCKTQRASYYSGPKNLYLNYQKKFQLSFNLNFLSYPNLLTSCQVKTKAETYLNYTTEIYRRYKTEEKMKEVKVKEEEVDRGGEVRKGGRKTKKEEEGEKKRKEKEKEREDLGSSWPSWTRSGSDLQEGHPAQGPDQAQGQGKGRNGQGAQWTSTKAKAKADAKAQ